MWLRTDDSQGHMKNLEELIGTCSDTLESELKTQKREQKKSEFTFSLSTTLMPLEPSCAL